MSNEDIEILEEFILETREHLAEIEPDLLEMEQLGEKVSPEIINRIFRAIHSTKGGASFLSFENLKNFSHVMENVLMQIRDGAMVASPQVVDVLLRSVDVLRAMIDDVQASDQVPCDVETDALNALLKGERPALGTAPTPGADAASAATASGGDLATADTPAAGAPLPDEQQILERVNQEELRGALAGGMNLYFVTLDAAADLREQKRTLTDVVSIANSIGKCLWVDDKTNGVERVMLIATVLTPDMAFVPLEIPESRFRKYDAAALRKKLIVEKERAPEKTAMPISQPAAGDVPPVSSGGSGGGAGGPGPSGSAKPGSDVLRVKVNLLTKLMNMAGELVLGRNQLLRALEHKADEIPGLVAILQHVDRVTTELQEGIMQTRMQPIGVLFSRYQRVVRDMARSLGKEIGFVTEGAEVELDKSIIEMLADPLTHIIRNSVDHGLEGPAEREASGKGRSGRITVTAFHEGGQVNIIISDDGRGIRIDKVLSKAIEKGIVDQAGAARLSHRDIVNLVMAPGFSTADQISDISGRGVGMDVVRTNIERLGGSIELETTSGTGTTVMLRLPLTLAIIPSLIVGVEDARFAVPQVGIVELVLVRAEDVQKRIEVIGGAPTLRLRGKLLPLVRLADLLDIERHYTDPETGDVRPERRREIADPRPKKQRCFGHDRTHWQSDYNILVLRSGGNQFGVIVDELFDIEEIVVKPLSSFLKETKCFAGTTILGDGRVIMILDTGGIADLADLKFSEIDREQAERKALERETNATTKSIILFNNADEEVFAVSQDKVLRLERIYAKDIEIMGNQRFIKYRGTGLPVVRLDEHIPIAPMPDALEELFLIIPKHAQNGSTAGSRARGGIMASRIIDAMDVEVTMQKPFFNGPGLEGAAIVGDKLTLFLDPVALLSDIGIVEGGAVQ